MTDGVPGRRPGQHDVIVCAGYHPDRVLQARMGQYVKAGVHRCCGEWGPAHGSWCMESGGTCTEGNEVENGRYVRMWRRTNSNVEGCHRHVQPLHGGCTIGRSGGTDRAWKVARVFRQVNVAHRNPLFRREFRMHSYKWPGLVYHGTNACFR